MAVRFLAREVSDLCLGKPPLRSLPSSATVADALSALKSSGETHVSIWACSCDNNHHSNLSAGAAIAGGGVCRCVGKVCMVDVICFLCGEKNLVDPSAALRGPVSDLLDKAGGGSVVRHLEPHSSLMEAIEYILEGAQNLIVPIETRATTFASRKKHLIKPSSFSSTLHNGREFCWLSQEDVVRFFLNSIGVFSPIAAFTIESLDIIETNIMSVYYDDPASSALDSISLSLTEQKSIAVVNEDNKLIGEISPHTLCCCDETVAAAISTLSAGDLMAYLDYSGPPEDLVNLVKERLEERNLGAILELMEEDSYSSSLLPSSSDEESGLGRGCGSGRNFPARRSETIVCRRWSSLVAVMIQTLAHRVSHVWVVEEDFSIVGIVTFAGILKVFQSIAGVRQKA